MVDREKWIADLKRLHQYCLNPAYRVELAGQKIDGIFLGPEGREIEESKYHTGGNRYFIGGATLPLTRFVVYKIEEVTPW